MVAYLRRVEHRADQGVSPLEDIERDTLQRSIAQFEQQHGPFEKVVALPDGFGGWKLIGRVEGAPDMYCAVAAPMSMERL